LKFAQYFLKFLFIFVEGRRIFDIKTRPKNREIEKIS